MSVILHGLVGQGTGARSLDWRISGPALPHTDSHVRGNLEQRVSHGSGIGRLRGASVRSTRQVPSTSSQSAETQWPAANSGEWA